GAELDVDETAVRNLVQQELISFVPQQVRLEIARTATVKHTIEVKLPDGACHQIEGKTHAKFERAVRLAAARRSILLVGPAGSGKTHLAHQVAQALGLNFASISCSAAMSAGHL